MSDLCYSVSLYLFFICFFFFKQKTAYEMRISDWSSDVCSSDLLGRRVLPCEGSMIVQPILDEAVMREMRKAPIGDEDQQWAVARKNDVFCARKSGGSSRVDQRMQTRREAAEQRNQHIQRFRSEEHTSELQSLMRTSHAVFCLK